MQYEESKCPVFKQLNIDNCCGCEACITICPNNALSLREDRDGFLFPILDENSCINCGKCVRVCPILNADPGFNEKEQYYGFSHKDDTILLKSASGGVFSFIYEAFMNTYPIGYVSGAVYSEDCKSIYHIVSNKESDFFKMRGSKYFQSRKGNVYQEIEQLLENGKAVLFSGAPCEVNALYNVLGKNYDNLLTVDFICKGSSTPRMLKEYIEYLEKKLQSNVIDINMRYKWRELDNWIPQFVRIGFKNGKQFLHEFYNTELGLCFQILQRTSCSSCPYREKKHNADFTLGDLHGANRDDLVYNNLGTSVVILNTDKAISLWSMWNKDHVRYRSIQKEDVYRNNRNDIDERSELLRFNLEKFNAVDAIRRTIGLKEKIKMKMPIKLLRKISSWRREYKK